MLKPLTQLDTVLVLTCALFNYTPDDERTGNHSLTSATDTRTVCRYNSQPGASTGVPCKSRSLQSKWPAYWAANASIRLTQQICVRQRGIIQRCTALCYENKCKIKARLIDLRRGCKLGASGSHWYSLPPLVRSRAGNTARNGQTWPSRENCPLGQIYRI